MESKVIFIIVFSVVIIFLLYCNLASKFIITDTSQKVVNDIYDLLQQTVNKFNETDTEYIITAGTLLGSVRHKGLIPWDDDADLIVFNKTPEQVLLLLKSLNQNIISYQHIKVNAIVVKFKNSTAVLDIFFMKKSINILNNSETYKYLFPYNIQYSNEWFTEDELYPLKDYIFGPLTLKGPNNADNFLNRAYPNWKNVSSKWNHDSYGKLDTYTDVFVAAYPDKNFILI